MGQKEPVKRTLEFNRVMLSNPNSWKSSKILATKLV